MPRPIREHSFGVIIIFAVIGLLMLVGLAKSIMGQQCAHRADVTHASNMTYAPYMI